VLVGAGAAQAADRPNHKPTRLWSEYPLGEKATLPAETTPPPRQEPNTASTQAFRPPSATTDDGGSSAPIFVALAAVALALLSITVVRRRARAPAAPALLASVPQQGAQSMSRFTRKNDDENAEERDEPEGAVVRLADKMSSYSVEDAPPGDSTPPESPRAEGAEADQPSEPMEEAGAPAPSSYAELGAHVSTMLAVTEETARQIIADARREADALRDEATEYAEKRRRDAQENAARITAKAADDASSLEQAGEESRRRMAEDSERHRQLVLLSQMIEESLRQTLASSRETLDQLETMVDELAGEAATWERNAPVEAA
jgi:hypothetical protein